MTANSQPNVCNRMMPLKKVVENLLTPGFPSDPGFPPAPAPAPAPAPDAILTVPTIDASKPWQDCCLGNTFDLVDRQTNQVYRDCVSVSS